MRPVPLLLLRAVMICLFALGLTPPAYAQDAAYFEMGPLNPGLPPAPAELDRETPMSTLEAFLDATQKGDYNMAAQMLDLTDLPQQNQRQAGPELAKKLSVLLDRKVVVPWRSLTDRPDGWISGSNDNNDTGRVRRSIILDWMEMGKREVAVRLNRVKPENSDAVWVFSRQTVQNIPELFRLYGPTQLERAMPDWSRQKAFWNMYIWEIFFVPLMLLVALFLGWATYRIVTAIGRRADTLFMNAIVRALRWPTTIILTTAFIGYATRNILVVSGIVDSIISPAVVIGYVTGTTLAMVFVIDEIFDRVSRHNPNELAEPENAHLRNMATTISAARKFVIVIAILLGAGVVLSSANSFESIGLSLLASAGALTIILGFAAREVLGNILASVQIALNRSARIGDQLIFEGHFCTVERIHFTYVQLLIWNGNRYVVPVSYFVKDAFENWSIEETHMLRPILLTLAQSADVDVLRDVFLKAIKEEDGEDTGPVNKATVRVVDHDMFGQKVRFELPTNNPATGWDMECKMRERLIAAAQRIEAEGDRRMLPSDTQASLAEA